MLHRISLKKILLSFVCLLSTITSCSDDAEDELINGNTNPHPEQVDPASMQLKLTIPAIIYVTVGTELNLWNDAVSLSVDKGLASPLNYQIKWISDIGIVTDRCFRFKPNQNEIGEHSCICTIYDLTYRPIEEKEFIIRVLPNEYKGKQVHCVYFGDSLGPGTMKELANNFNNNQKYRGIKPVFLGTKSSHGIHHEAVGGYTFYDYATQGRNAFRVEVSNIKSLELDAIYTIDNKNFSIVEINMTNGKGNILLLRQNYGDKTNFPESGTLTKVSGAGDSSISYKNGYKENNNPLWNPKENRLDVNAYKKRIGLSDKESIDIVSFQFGINDAYLADDLGTLKQYIDNLYQAFMASNPHCKFILGMAPSAGNDVNGAGANYGASFDWITYLKQTYTLRKFYLELSPKEYPNLLIAPAHLGLDRYYGYGFSNRPISDRNTNAENYHHNFVHPCESGYQQIADIYLGTYVAAMMDE